MARNTLQAVRGMNDILPADADLWAFFDETVRHWLTGYGYRTIRTPIVEMTELFVRSIGENTDIVEKEMYSFVDQLNGESLTLRPEGTASCVRAVLQHNLLYPGPQRLCYCGPMFRHERPQKGRYRQFHQVGLEALGYEGPDIDAEHIIMCARLWKSLGLSGLRLQINTLGSGESRARFRNKLIAYLEQNQSGLDEDARRRMHSNPLRVLDSKNPELRDIIKNAPVMIDELDDVAKRHFTELQTLLRNAGIEFEINPRLVRGLDYYNFTVFEWLTDQLGAQATICAGGRYDGLVEQLGGKATSACGFAMGTERLLALLSQTVTSFPTTKPDVYLVHQGQRAGTFAWEVAERLRDSGIRVVFHCGGGSFKSQMKKADGSDARYAVIIGDDEAESGEASLKPLRGTGEQIRVSLGQLINAIQSN